MALTTSAANALIKLLLENANWAAVGDATGLRGSSTAGVFYISLHTSSPGTGGNQSTNEISYTGYARVSVARSGSGWTDSGGTGSNAAAITFGACTAGSGTAAYVGLGTDSSGSGNLVAYAQVTTPSGGLAISAGITPNIAIGNLDWIAS